MADGYPTRSDANSWQERQQSRAAELEAEAARARMPRDPWMRRLRDSLGRFLRRRPAAR